MREKFELALGLAILVVQAVGTVFVFPFAVTLALAVMFG